MRSVLSAIDAHPDLELLVAVTGMHLMEEFGGTLGEVRSAGFQTRVVQATFAEDDKPSMARFLADCVSGLVDLVQLDRPDVILVLGDRAEMLAAAIAGSYLSIPVAHIHGGDLSSTVDDLARHAITKLSHIHFPATEASARRIIQMGESPERVHVVGAPGLHTLKQRPQAPPEELLPRYGLNPDEPFILVIQHPTTESLHAAEQMRETLSAVSETGRQALVIYPNADAGGREMIKVIGEFAADPRIHPHKSLPHDDYLGVLASAAVMVGNSSSAIIEAPSFGVPVVNVGGRQAGRERAASVLDAGHSRVEIEAAIEKALTDDEVKAAASPDSNPYDGGDTGAKIAAELAKVKIGGDLLQKRFREL